MTKEQVRELIREQTRPVVTRSQGDHESVRRSIQVLWDDGDITTTPINGTVEDICLHYLVWAPTPAVHVRFLSPSHPCPEDLIIGRSTHLRVGDQAATRLGAGRVVSEEFNDLAQKRPYRLAVQYRDLNPILGLSRDEALKQPYCDWETWREVHYLAEKPEEDRVVFHWIDNQGRLLP